MKVVNYNYQRQSASSDKSTRQFTKFEIIKTN